MNTLQFSRQLDVVARPDVLVCGAGTAGTVAAISAARQGASTMVVDRHGFAGGFITAVVGPSLDGFIDLRSRLPVVGGVAFELGCLTAGVDPDSDTTRYQSSTELRFESPDVKRVAFDVEQFKLHADRLLKGAGARILYHTQIVEVVRDGDRVEAVIIGNKGGLGVIAPKTVVDATGDADIVTWAGAPTEIHDTLQPLSLHFRIAAVDITPELRHRCTDVLREAHEAGELGLYGGPFINRLGPGELYVNATRFPGRAIDPDDLTTAEIQGREDANRIFELWKERVPEFKNAYFAASGPEVGARESRRIVGESTLTSEDIERNRPREDVVVKGAWWVDRHPPTTAGDHMRGVDRKANLRPYDIAFGTLLPRGLANVVVAGRCHSADSLALASSRVTVTAMGMGQAAGTAAALAVQRGRDLPDVDIAGLQQRLLADGAIILERAEKVLEVGDTLGDAVEEALPRF